MVKNINWMLWKKKCPNCGSIDIKKINKFKREYIKKRGKFTLMEKQKMKCEDCDYEFWK